MRVSLATLICLLACLSASAQGWERTIQEFQHTAWGAKEGAPSAVQALAQTSDGFLWLGTSDGLYRFDGMTFEPFKPPAWSAFPVLDVRSLWALPDGSLWVGFSFGVVSVIRDGDVRNYGAADGVPGRVVDLAQDREGTMWASTTAGLARLEGNRWKVLGKDWNFPGKAAYGMFVDRQGTLWVASENTIVFLPAGAREFKPTGTHVGAVWHFAEAKNGKLWMAETTRSVRPVPLNTEPAPSDDTEVRVGSVAMLFDRDGALWITTLGDGMRRAPAPEMLHGKIGEFSTAVESFTSKDGLSDDSVNAILQDREGNIWVGTHKGLDRFRKTNLIPIALPFQVLQLAAGDDGDIWVWTNHMIRMNEGHAYQLSSNRFGDSLSEGSYRGPDGITWWIGMYGIYRFERGRFSRLPLPKELPTPYAKGVFVAEDRSHGLWAAVERDGVFHLKNGKWTKFNAGPEARKSHPEAAFTDWMGRVWFGYERGSIVILNGTTVEKVFPPQESPVGGIRAIAGGNGHVWVGGDLGLAFFQGGRFHPVIPIDAPQFRTVFSILEASGGDLWLCESRGVIHISSAEVQKLLHNPDYRPKYELFDSFDGLPGTFRDAGRLSKVVQATDGRLWFVASDGIAWLDPGHISRNLLPPPVTIESLTADDKRYLYRLSPALPPLTSHLEIKFAALSLSNPEQDHFRYKLEGYDKGWRDAGTQRQASYTNLSPRKYRFRVIASNNDGVWNEEGAALDFSILPAWYQTIWFRSLCVAAFGLFLWGLYQVRLQQLERQFNETLSARLSERTRIARELHDTLLQSLHGLMFQFQAARNMLPPRPENEKATQALDEAILGTEQAITESQNAIEGLRSEPPAQMDLARLLTTTGQELGALHNTNLDPPTLNVIVEGEPQVLSARVQEDAYRIGREALLNAFRHAHAHHIEVEVRYQVREFRMCIRDDGAGMDQKILARGGRAGHWGLPGARERAERLGAQLHYWSAAGKGTEVQLTVPAAAAYEKPQEGIAFRLFRKARSHERQS